jgi:hypothetical protein
MPPPLFSPSPLRSHQFAELRNANRPHIHKSSDDLSGPQTLGKEQIARLGGFAYVILNIPKFLLRVTTRVTTRYQEGHQIRDLTEVNTASPTFAASSA